jgi:hypothetical protein
VGQRPVLYLALEDGHRRLQQRFRTIMANQPIPQGMHVIIHAQTHESDPDDYRVSGPQPWPYVRLISVSSQQPVDAATAALLPRTGRRTNVRQIRCGVGD